MLFRKGKKEVLSKKSLVCLFEELTRIGCEGGRNLKSTAWWTWEYATYKLRRGAEKEEERKQDREEMGINDMNRRKVASQIFPFFRRNKSSCSFSTKNDEFELRGCLEG